EEPHAQLARQHRESFDHHNAPGTPFSTRFSCNTCRIDPSIITGRLVDMRTGMLPAFTPVSVSWPRSPGTPASRLTTVTCLVSGACTTTSRDTDKTPSRDAGKTHRGWLRRPSICPSRCRRSDRDTRPPLGPAEVRRKESAAFAHMALARPVCALREYSSAVRLRTV